MSGDTTQRWGLPRRFYRQNPLIWINAEWTSRMHRTRDVVLVAFALNAIAVVPVGRSFYLSDRNLVGWTDELLTYSMPGFAVLLLWGLSEGLLLAYAVVVGLWARGRALRGECRFCGFGVGAGPVAFCRDCGRSRPLNPRRVLRRSLGQWLAGERARRSSPGRNTCLTAWRFGAFALSCFTIVVFVVTAAKAVRFPDQFMTNIMGHPKHLWLRDALTDHGGLIAVALLVGMWLALRLASAAEVRVQRRKRKAARA